jgi:hypothetical protein
MKEQKIRTLGNIEARLEDIVGTIESSIDEDLMRAFAGENAWADVVAARGTLKRALGDVRGALIEAGAGREV